MNRVPLEIFSLDILIILVVTIPFALTPSLLVVTESRQTHHTLTVYCHRKFGPLSKPRLCYNSSLIEPDLSENTGLNFAKLWSK